MTAAALRDDSKGRRVKDVTINLRATPQVRELIDMAAEVVGKTRSEFMLESARLRARDVLMDQTFFVLDDEKFAEFSRLLDTPPAPTAALKRLFAKKAPWEP